MISKSFNTIKTGLPQLKHFNFARNEFPGRPAVSTSYAARIFSLPIKATDKVSLDLNSMINEVITSLDEDSPLNTYNRMKALGEHVNLMLSRGDLVLSGIEFDK